MEEIVVNREDAIYKNMNKLMGYNEVQINTIIDMGITMFELSKHYSEIFSSSDKLSEIERLKFEGQIRTYEERLDELTGQITTLKFESSDSVRDAIDAERGRFDVREREITDRLREHHSREVAGFEARIQKLTEDITTVRTETAKEYVSRIDKLTEEIKTVRNETAKEYEEKREASEKQYKENIEFLRKSLTSEREEKKGMLSLFRENVDAEVARITSDLKAQVDELSKQNAFYHNLYADKNKGSFYESELLTRLHEYNETKLGSIWRIEHVGSKCSEKCDFHFRHKDTGSIILLDTKNNTASSNVKWTDVEKFHRDVNSEENHAIGGILLANSNISRKKDFEIETANNRVNVYVSNYNLDNVAFVFAMLDLIMEQSKNRTGSMSEDELIEMYIHNYKFFTERLANITREQKKYEAELSDLRNEFSTRFDDDIEVVMSADKKVKVQHTAGTDILDYDELEAGRVVKLLSGTKRTKFYLQYEDEGEQVIQYFKSSYGVNRRQEALDKKKEKAKVKATAKATAKKTKSKSKSAKSPIKNAVITLADLL